MQYTPLKDTEAWTKEQQSNNVIWSEKFRIKFPVSFVPCSPINYNLALVQIMACRLSASTMVILFMYASQAINDLHLSSRPVSL